MKELAGDESLSEEARDTAMKALEMLVASELEEIEQVAAARKRDAELQELQSEAKKRIATLNDMESEAHFIESEQSVALKKQSVALEKMESEVQFINQQARAEQKKARAEAEAERRKATTERLHELDAGTEAEMIEWLGRHRLSRHADTIADVVGLYVC